MTTSSGQGAAVRTEADRLIREARFGDAGQLLREHLGQHPDDLAAAYMLGLAAYRDGDDRAAEAAFRTVVRGRPGDAKACYSLGITLARRGNTEEATIWLEAALAADPGFSRARDRLEQLRSSGERSELAHRLDRGEPVAKEGPGDLLRRGHRRVSSYGHHFVGAALLGTAGALLVLGGNAVVARWLGDRWPFGPDIGSLRRFVQTAPPGHGRELARQELAAALAEVENRVDTSEQVLLAGGLLALVVALMVAGYPLLAAPRTTYAVFQRRIDLATGVLNRRRRSVWLYEIRDVVLREPARLTVTGNAEVRILTDDGSLVRITGFGTTAAQEALWHELRDAAISERRAMRRWWV